MHDTGIADRLRAAGLKVVEVAGWQTRGSAVFQPIGSLDHHTAGARTGNAPSLAVCIYGRSDLPGPLCHVLIGRDNTCYVIAAGRANHAGKGQWGAANGNEDLYGIERENVGTTAEPWREDQTDTAARAHAALIRGRVGAATVARHAEYALPPGRKPDTHSVSGPDLRRRVGEYLTKSGGTLPLPPEDDMSTFAMIREQDDPRVYFTDGKHRMVVEASGPDGMQGYRELRDHYRDMGHEVVEAAPDRAKIKPRWLIANLIPWRPGIDDKYLPFPTA